MNKTNGCENMINITHVNGVCVYVHFFLQSYMCFNYSALGGRGERCPRSLPQPATLKRLSLGTEGQVYVEVMGAWALASEELGILQAAQSLHHS